MSRRKTPHPGALVFSILYRDESLLCEAVRRLEDRFGNMRDVTGPLPFDGTSYYREEMGEPLHRRFAVAGSLVERDSLRAAKVEAERIEAAVGPSGGGRSVNIDPGLLTQEQLVLATGKNYVHRIYLGEGVFADLALLFESGEYRPLPWTYPDYASVETRAFFMKVRRWLRQELGFEERGRG